MDNWKKVLLTVLGVVAIVIVAFYFYLFLTRY
ncbi:hypothetical protein EB08_00135 [Enterococcus cecorum]|nr:hypothetical protein EB08_00135 [Enterococcus cecorum]RBR37467.1 hypothetical protein EB26_00455 [Enterococcus cecorum]RBR39251.1 hypothetical protein EB31_00137 [Enterococcus cecorum]